MARKVRASGFETRTARLKRPVAKKPEFVRIAPGISLGYRRNATAGTWVARVADGRGGNWTKAIGSADDYDEADETVENLGVITPLNGTKRMLAPTFGCGMVTVKGSRSPLGQQFMDRPAGAGPGRAR
jgi:hypothetical protein